MLRHTIHDQYSLISRSKREGELPPLDIFWNKFITRSFFYKNWKAPETQLQSKIASSMSIVKLKNSVANGQSFYQIKLRKTCHTTNPCTVSSASSKISKMKNLKFLPLMALLSLLFFEANSQGSGHCTDHQFLFTQIHPQVVLLSIPVVLTET